MKRNSTDQQDAIQLLSDDETRTLTLALFEGAGGFLKDEEFEAAMETVFEWAEKIRLESASLDSILRGKLSVRCGPDGEMEFKTKDSELCEPSESVETDRPLR